MSEILRQRLQECLDNSGRSASSLCEEAGVNRDTIRNILRGRSKAPCGASVARLAIALGTTSEYLYGLSSIRTGDPVSAISDTAETAPLDADLLAEIIAATQDWLNQADLDLPSNAFASLVCQFYTHFSQNADKERSIDSAMMQTLSQINTLMKET